MGKATKPKPAKAAVATGAPESAADNAAESTLDGSLPTCTKEQFGADACHCLACAKERLG